MEGLLLILIGVLGGIFINNDRFALKCALGLAIILILVTGGK